MKPKTLKTRIFCSSFAVVLVLGLCIFFLGHYLIKTDIVGRAQDQLEHDLAGARYVYGTEIENIGEVFKLVSHGCDITKIGIKEKFGLDYVAIINVDDIDTARSEIVKVAFERSEGIGGTRLIAIDEMDQLDSKLSETKTISIKHTLRARPVTKKVVDGVMAKEYALPLLNSDGSCESVIYGGRIINRDYALVDKIKEMVFGNDLYNDKPLGTVTIFQDDTRISTNVLTEEGERAIGTCVSAEVYEQVVEQGKLWHDRAFVVNDWYKTAYEPIKNISGDIIGILYVGILEKPFEDLAENAMMLFILIILVATVLAGILSFVLAATVSRPITDLLTVTQKLSGGDFGCEVTVRSSVTELNKLATAFNIMSVKLKEREENLNISNAKLEELNKSYLDLIGFVSHELKGMLSSTIMNSYALRDGFLGMINFKQKRAVDSITRNLDFLAATVKKFLNLSRIEKDQLEPNKTEFLVFQDVIEVSLDTFEKPMKDKNIAVVNNIAEDLKIFADLDLMLVVANNLISNAVKYGQKDGRIEVAASEDDNYVTISVYNDSRPITDKDAKSLFKRFARLDVPEKKTVKGTGLGLFITKQIVDAHGGDIRVQANETGNTFIFRLPLRVINVREEKYNLQSC